MRLHFWYISSHSGGQQHLTVKDKLIHIVPIMIGAYESQFAALKN